MNISLDQESLNILRQAFEWRDYDQDGYISLQDLKQSVGIQRTQDALHIFQALKSPTNHTGLITFQQFSSRVLDFPLLLKQIKRQICESEDIYPHLQTQISIEIPSLELQESVTLTEIAQITQFFQAAIQGRVQLSPTERESIKSELDFLVSITKALYSKSADYQISEEAFPMITYGTFKLATKLHSLIMNETKEKASLQNKLHHAYISVESLAQNIKRLEQTNKNLIRHLSEMEKNKLKIQQENESILAEKQELRLRLHLAQSLKSEAKNQINKIQLRINQKESALEHLQKELKTLKSLKTIQEMKGSINKKAINPRKSIKQSRSTLPVSSHTLASPTNQESRIIEFHAINSQAKNQKIRILQQKVHLLKSNMEKMKKNHKKLKEKNLELTLKLNQERIQSRLETERFSSIRRSSSVFSQNKGFQLMQKGGEAILRVRIHTCEKEVQCMLMRENTKQRSNCWACIQ